MKAVHNVTNENVERSEILVNGNIHVFSITNIQRTEPHSFLMEGS
jgi:hypothetical protein